MPTRQTYEKASLASGEISPELHAATDLRAHQTGLAAQENFVTVLEGIAVRRPGTRFVLEAKDHTQRGKFWPFRYASGDYYMLAFNGGKMRVIRDAGYVTSGGLPFEVSIPWNEAQLKTLRAAPIANTVTFTVTGGRIRKITRIAADNWTIEEYLPLNGPVEAQNLDPNKLVSPSAITGTVTLNGVNNPFTFAMEGGVMRLDEANAVLTQLWTANETLSAPLAAAPAPASVFGDLSPLANLTDGNATTVATRATASNCYAGFHYSSAVRFAAMTIAGIPPTAGAPPGTGTGGFTDVPTNLVLEVWGKNGAASATGTDGTLLGSTTVLDSGSFSSGVTIYADNATLSWDNVWFRISSLSGTRTFGVSSAAAQALTSGGFQPVLRRWNDNIYVALAGGNSGVSPPVHDSGDASYGGITWRFRSKTYGFVRLDDVVDSNTATGAVTMQLPDSALLAPSYRWSPPAWGDGLGWPEFVLQNRQKFLFFRANRLWATRPATRDDFQFTADTDSAIAVVLTPPDEQSLPEIRWAASAGIVVLGTADVEWMLRAPASNDVLQAQTIDPVPDSTEGSVAQIPCKVDRGVIFAGATGKRLHYLKFDALTQQLAPEEVSAAARHIPLPGVVATAWQKDPHKILWIVLADGTLAAMTFMPGQKIVALHRHPMGNAFVEDVAALPALDGGRTEIYLWVKRTINGATKRYIELLQPFFAPRDAADPTAAGAWFVDCGLRYSGAPVTHISGADHLENEVVAVFADGAMQKPKRVIGGGFDLDAPASEVVIGIPIRARLQDLPRSLQLGGGSSRGKPQRASHVIVDVLNSAGGTVRMTHPKPDRNAGADDTPFDDLIETGGDMYGAPIRLFTGQIPVVVSDEEADSAVVEIVCDDAMPCAVRAMAPELLVEGD